MFLFALFLDIGLFFVNLMMKDGLELALDILLSPKLPFVVDLASNFSNFNTLFNEFILDIVSFLEGTDILALDIFLVIHDHLIVLKKMK